MVDVQVKRLNDDIKLPTYATDLAAGMDVYAPHDVHLLAGESTLIRTGLFMAIPRGYELQVRPRSGLALKQQITVLNSPGTIDADYRGEIGVILINHGHFHHYIDKGDRIAQLVLKQVETARLIEVDELDDTVRGEGGFGSTDQINS